MTRARSPWVYLQTGALGILLLAGCEQSAAVLPTATATHAYGPTATPAGPRATPAPTSIPAGKDWIALGSTTPDAILAAVRQAPLVQLSANSPPGSEGYTDFAHLGTPVLVAAYNAPGDAATAAPDFYEVPVRTPAGLLTDTINAELNRDHTAIFVGSISGAGPGSQWPVQLVSADQAAQIVGQSLQVAPRPGTAPKLVYLAAYDGRSVMSGQINWAAGGGGPQIPIWLVPGADGQDYFVGTDGHAYTVAQLPLLR